jgi:gluconokinase
LRQRHNHYMKQSMLESQLATLEEPVDALIEPADLAPEQIVQQIRESLALI